MIDEAKTKPEIPTDAIRWGYVRKWRPFQDLEPPDGLVYVLMDVGTQEVVCGSSWAEAQERLDRVLEIRMRRQKDGTFIGAGGRRLRADPVACRRLFDAMYPDEEMQRRERLLAETQEQYEKLRSDPQAWEDFQRDISPWHNTLGDGVEIEDDEPLPEPVPDPLRLSFVDWAMLVLIAAILVYWVVTSVVP